MDGRKAIGLAGGAMLIAAVVFLAKDGDRVESARGGPQTPALAGTLEQADGAASKAGQTPVTGGVLELIESGSVADVKSRLRAGANVNDIGEQGVTPLHRAAALGRTDIIHVLTEAGADLSLTDGQGRAPTDVAANEDVVTLLGLVAKHRRSGWSALSTAVLRNDKDAVEFLIATGGDVNAELAGDRRPLLTAVTERRSDFVSLLINKGAEVNFVREDGSDALLLHEAAKVQAADIMQMLTLQRYVS